jgi:hypothetical protein
VAITKGLAVMKAKFLNAISIAVLALAPALAGAADDPKAVVLTFGEVRALASRAAPGDHLRLTTHFSARADEYAAEVQRHAVMSTAFGTNANRRLKIESAPHCARLAELNAVLAATMRELAAHHAALAPNPISANSRDDAAFDRVGTPSSSGGEALSLLAARACTPSDHWMLYEYFLSLASRSTVEGDEYAVIARAYRARANERDAAQAVRCDRLVMLLRDAGREANATAAIHEALAGLS